MTDFRDKTKEELIQELEEALKKIGTLERPKAEQKKVKEALQISEQRFRNIVQSSPMGIHMYKLEPGNRLVFCGANPAADLILGVDNSQFIDKTIEEAFPPLKETEVPERYRLAAAKGESWRTGQLSYQDKQISGVFEVYAFQTGPNTMAAMFLDTTERKRTEEALLFTQFSIDHMADAAFWMGADARFIYVNKAACRSLGYKQEELLSMSVHDIDPNFPREVWADHWKEVKERGSFSIESLHRTKEGRLFPVEVTVNYLEFEGKEFNCAVVRDISRRKQADQELRASEEKYRQLVQLSNDAIYILYNRKFELINEKFKELFNVTLEYVKRPEFDFIELVAPRSRAYIEERNQKSARGEKLSPRYYFTALSRDKKEIEIEASVTYIKYKEGIAVQGILRDVTERKRMEEKLHQAQKLEAIGTLAGGIAHDFNNILMGIQGRVSLMLLKAESPSFIEHLKGIEEYVESASELTKQLLGFARGGKYELKPVNINELIKRSSSMFGRTKKEIKIHEKYQEDIWVVEADAGQIEQVLLNLYVNAWQAMPAGGNLYLQTENITITENESKSFDGAPGRYVNISITDTGIGMDEATMERIFDPFFTTRQMGRGTGLGLATVYGIMKNHGGFVNVYSEVGKGTTFNLYMPVSEKAPQEKRVPLGKVWRGSGTILLVDDEDMILDVTSPILNDLGYDILIARSGQEAVEVYKSKQDQVDLVILDIVMPGMSGGESFDRLKEINPHVKVLLSSGYSINEQAADILKRGGRGFIQKPFDLERLSLKLKEILEKE